MAIATVAEAPVRMNLCIATVAEAPVRLNLVIATVAEALVQYWDVSGRKYPRSFHCLRVGPQLSLHKRGDSSKSVLPLDV